MFSKELLFGEGDYQLFRSLGPMKIIFTKIYGMEHEKGVFRALGKVFTEGKYLYVHSNVYTMFGVFLKMGLIPSGIIALGLGFFSKLIFYLRSSNWILMAMNLSLCYIFFASFGSYVGDIIIIYIPVVYIFFLSFINKLSYR